MPPRKYYPIRVFGFETQAPRWALTLLALVLIGGAAVFVYQKTYGLPEQQILTLKDANRQLAAEIEEYSRHAMEETEKHALFEEADGKILLRVFKDHCVLIQRQSLRGTRTKLVADLARVTVSGPVEPMSLLPVVYAAEQQNPCGRGCLNPHPGQFRWWYGQRRGDWVEVWRQWACGCTHYQLFHVPTGSWDSHPDGSPKVYWSCCVH